MTLTPCASCQTHIDAQEDNVRRKEASKALQQAAKRRKTGDKPSKQAPAQKQWWQEEGDVAAVPDDDRAVYRQEVWPPLAHQVWQTRLVRLRYRGPCLPACQPSLC